MADREEELRKACLNGDTDAVPRLIRLDNINVHCRCPGSGYTPLHWASFHGYTTIVRNGANIDCPCYNGGTPIHAACSGGSVNVGYDLLDRGATLHCQDTDPFTGPADSPFNQPWQLPASLLSMSWIHSLLNWGADVNDQYSDGTLLHLASEYETYFAMAMVQYLVLEKGANIEMKNRHGRTPLEQAREKTKEWRNCLHRCISVFMLLYSTRLY